MSGGRLLRYSLAGLCIALAVFFLLPLAIGAHHIGMFFPAAVLIPVDSGYEWHMATFFYESCVDALIFLVLWFGVRKRKRWNGQLLAVYMLMYGIGRAVIEGLRMDSLYSGSIRISQIVSITLAAVGLIWLLIGTFARKNPQREG